MLRRQAKPSREVNPAPQSEAGHTALKDRIKDIAPPEGRHGRAALSNRSGRFEREIRERVDDGGVPSRRLRR
jgi:hypothetical protein